MDLSGSPFAMITAEKLSNNGLGRSFICFLWSFIDFCSIFFFIFFFCCSCCKVGWSLCEQKLGFSDVAVGYIQVFWKQAGHRFFPVMVLCYAVRNRVYRAQIVGIAQGGLTRTMCHLLSQYVRGVFFFHGPIPKKSMESVDLMEIHMSIALLLACLFACLLSLYWGVLVAGSFLLASCWCGACSSILNQQFKTKTKLSIKNEANDIDRLLKEK